MDLVIVNLYPFEQTLARGDASEQEIIENIDIGGPTMIRAAAKNVAFAAVVVDPGDYPAVLAELRENDGRLSATTRSDLARKAFATTARYDAAISGVVLALLRGLPAQLVGGLREGPRPALRREPPPAGRLLLPRRRRTPPAGGRQPAARQGAVLQQPARPQLRTGAGRRLRRAGLRDRQAQQPLRLRGGRQRRAGLRPRLRLRPPERLRRGDRAQPARRSRGRREAVRPVHRGAAGALASSPRRWRSCRRKKNVRLLELPDWPARSERVEGRAGARRPARADPRRGRRDARADARHDRRRAGRGAVAGPPVRVAGLPSRPLQRDRDRPRPGHDRDRRRPDEQGGRRPHRDREGTDLPARAAGRLEPRLRRLLPVRRRSRARPPGRRHGGSSSRAARSATRRSWPPSTPPGPRWSPPARRHFRH